MLKDVGKAHGYAYWRIYRDTVANAPREVDFIERALGLEKGASILDVGCGFGRHSIELAKRGYKVTGVDLSSYLLEIAKKRAKKTEVKVEFINCDIRNLKGKEKFDAAIMMLNVFGLMSESENKQIIAKIAELLRPRESYLLIKETQKSSQRAAYIQK